MSTDKQINYVQHLTSSIALLHWLFVWWNFRNKLKLASKSGRITVDKTLKNLAHINVENVFNKPVKPIITNQLTNTTKTKDIASKILI